MKTPVNDRRTCAARMSTRSGKRIGKRVGERLAVRTAAQYAMAALWLGAAATSQALPVLRFDKPAVAVRVGDSFELALQGTGFDTTTGGLSIDNLSGGQKLNFGFPPGTLQVTSIVIDPRWTFVSANKPGVVDNLGGSVTGLAFGTFPATADDSFDIAQITFQALRAGVATVVVTAADLAGRVDNRAGTTIAADYLPAMLQVSAVPEPQIWALLAAGLSLLAFKSRRA